MEEQTAHIKLTGSGLLVVNSGVGGNVGYAVITVVGVLDIGGGGGLDGSLYVSVLFSSSVAAVSLSVFQDGVVLVGPEQFAWLFPEQFGLVVFVGLPSSSELSELFTSIWSFCRCVYNVSGLTH